MGGPDPGGVAAALARAVPRGAAALVAVSGGPDSVALLHLVAQARPDLILSVGHVRHGLRDDARDAEIAAAHAATLGLPFHLRAVRVDPDGPGGVEAAARRARYDALAEMARAAGAGWVLVGHTADDQAETVLLNAARGSGTRGLAGMPPSRPLGTSGLMLARPLLGIPRATVRALIAERGLEVAEDPTNADVGRRRARARHATLPVLAGLTGHESVDALRDALVRLAALARDDADALDALAARYAAAMIVAVGPGRALRIDAVAALPPALASRVVRRLLVEAGAEPDAAAVAAARRLTPGGAMHVPGGVWVTAGGGWLAAAPPGSAVQERPHHVPGQVVRGRRPGDRVGGRPLKAVLAPVPRALRDLVPIVARGAEVVEIGAVPPFIEAVRTSGDIPPEVRTASVTASDKVPAMSDPHDDIAEVLIDAEQIQERVRAIAKEIDQDYAGRNVLLVGVLKGAFVLMADLARYLTVPAEFDFMAVSSYGSATKTSGVVRILKDLERDIVGRDVLLVEDIVDSGLTLNYLLRNLRARGPASLEVLALLSKPDQTRVPIPLRYHGFAVPNVFVVGYGLDYAERYRNLPYVGTLRPEVSKDPGATVTP